jgi:hypothetical protein
MKKYKVVVEGRNCLIELGNIAQRHGFFTTRFIEAEDTSTAGQIAVDLVKKELTDTLLNDQFNPPSMYVDEVGEVRSFGDNLVPGKGFTWYPEYED